MQLTRYSPMNGLVAAIVGTLFLLLSQAIGLSPPSESSPADLIPSKAIPASPEIIELGKRIYERQCAPCHGLDGRGNGEAAYLLYPKPRDFVAANYRMVSTWDGVPTDSDLYFTISRGIPGSAMPSWSHLTEEERWGLVHFVKSFADYPIEAPTYESVSDSGIVKIPPEPTHPPESPDYVQQLFIQSCAPCHGVLGEGDGTKEQIDDLGFPTRPRDLTRGIYKGGPEPEQVYLRIVAGMPGSPMPSSSWAYGDDAWYLTRFVLAMSSEIQRQKAEMRKYHIAANRVDQVPEHPDDGAWRDAPGVDLHLMPLWWRDDRPEILNVKALHDGEEIAIRLLWDDETNDHTAIRAHEFRDAVAVQFSTDADPPFFAMGERGRFINLWMWKSERQADLEPAFQDIDKVYPNIGIDSYPNPEVSALEQPTRQALTLESDPTFVTGWGAGNIVSNPWRPSAAEDLVAQGFGTLQALPVSDQVVQAKGAYDLGSYRVVFRRTLRGVDGESVDLMPGEKVSVAFAVWNGSAGDRDGKKSVTIWQDLELVP